MELLIFRRLLAGPSTYTYDRNPKALPTTWLGWLALPFASPRA